MFHVVLFLVRWPLGSLDAGQIAECLLVVGAEGCQFRYFLAAGAVFRFSFELGVERLLYSFFRYDDETETT